MSSTLTETHAAAAADRPGKKSKHEKSRKRHRETTDLAEDGTERRHKKSKSEIPPDDAPAVHIVAPASGDDNRDGEGKKHKRSKKSKKAQPSADGSQDPSHAADQTNGVDHDGTGKDGDKDKDKKRSKKDKKDKKRRDAQEKEDQSAPAADSTQQDSTPAPSSKHRKSAARVATSPASQNFPFFTQTVSQYLPLFPQGMLEPIEGYAEQQLRPLLNRYVPAFRGVLLAYRNPRIGEAPGKGSLTETSDMDSTALLESVDEYAVTFSWLTVEADLFCPRRGSWMEGSLNLQSEGFVGVICYSMFNASIEASRLPSGWRWVDLMSGSRNKKSGRRADQAAAEAKLPTPEPADELENQNGDKNDGDENDQGEGNEADGTGQAHSTGYWVDEDGAKVSGVLRFRIKNYEVGSIGDYGYLSIEGTMLDEEAERAKMAEEMEVDRRRRLKQGGVLRKPLKRLPEFSMTKFREDEQEDDILRPTKSKKPVVGSDAAETAATAE